MCSDIDWLLITTLNTIGKCSMSIAIKYGNTPSEQCMRSEYDFFVYKYVAISVTKESGTD